MIMTILPLIVLALPVVVNGYTWSFTSVPEQCGNLSISISGNDGNPPYRILVIPFGPTPLPNFVEPRTIIDKHFEGSNTSLSFFLNYPSDSQFVAVVSDASGFGSGGTSVAATVQSGAGFGCYNSTVSVSPAFTFSIDPPNQIVQCTPTRLWWDNSNGTIDGTPTFLGVIPGGQSFTVPTGPITNVSNEGTGFSWTPSVRAGTTLILIGGDNRAVGNAGSTLNTIGFGTTVVDSCLNSTSPSSTPGSPAGGSYPTTTAGASIFANNNTGPIAGGTIGGIAFLVVVVLAALFLLKRKKVREAQKERPVDLFQDDEGDEYDGHDNARLPQYYQPEPFLVPEPPMTAAGSIHGTEEGGTLLGDRPLSGTTSRSGTPDLLSGAGSSTAATRKSGLRAMRPVNIIQHDDAGPSEGPKDEEGEPETIELPPAYTNLKSNKTSSVV